MTAGEENFVRRVLQALAEWWAGAGELAWMAAGVLLILAILVFGVTLRWILRGGLARQRFNR